MRSATLERRKYMFEKLTKMVRRKKLEKIINEQLRNLAEKAKTPAEIELVIGLREKANATKKSVSVDTVLVVLGNLAGILLILNFEKLNVLTSKAIPFVLKGRI